MNKIRVKPIKHPHRNLWYHFRFKKSGVPDIDSYMNKCFVQPPEIYKSGGYMELFEEDWIYDERKSKLPKLTAEALAIKEKVTPHTKVQKYLLEHDPYSIATEVPVSSPEYMVSGFIDLVRVVPCEKGKVIEILDFKPPGTERNVESQLSRYKQLFQMRTGTQLPINLGYFNQNGLWIGHPP